MHAVAEVSRMEHLSGEICDRIFWYEVRVEAKPRVERSDLGHALRELVG